MPLAASRRRPPPKPAPQADPRFRKVVENLKQGAAKVKAHPPGKKKAVEASAAAKGPPDEKLAAGKAQQVDKIQEAPAKKPETDSFLSLLRAEIQKAMPQTLGDAEQFMKGGQGEQIKGSLKGNVNQKKDEAAGGVKSASKEAPKEAGAAKPVTPIPPEAAPGAPAVNGAEGMPAPKPDADVSLQDSKQDADALLKEKQITPEQLKKANDPRFSSVLTAKDAVGKQADAGPAKYRAGEKGVLSAAAGQAQAEGRRGAAAVVGVRGRSNSAVLSKQAQAKAQEEKDRADVTKNIGDIFTATKTSVEAKLAKLETDVGAMFDVGVDLALKTMKDYVDDKIFKFKLERYLGSPIGLALLAKDELLGPAPEVNAILERGRTLFTGLMDALVVRVAAVVEQALKDAKNEVAKGQASIKKYVAGLDPKLRTFGESVGKEVSGKFQELESGIEDKKNQIAQQLAEKYKDASDKANAALKAVQDENKGLVDVLAEKVGEVWKILTEFKDKLMAILKKGEDTIKLILDDPVGFLGNLIAAIKLGFNQFKANIKTHLIKGFMAWLFGSLAEAGLEIPDGLPSLPSILKLVLSVLGITYERMRAKAVKLLGERAVKVIETLVKYVKALIDGGPEKLWLEVKADLSGLKDMVIGAIQDYIITTVVQRAIAKLVTLFNPVGAIVQAVLAIYDTVTFLIEKASQIMALIEAVVNSVNAIATGAIGGAANWIEQALARTIPVVIGFFAQFAGLGKISKKIKEFIQKIQAKVDKAIDAVIARVVATVKKLIGKLTGKDKDKDKEKDKEDGEKLKEADFKLPFSIGSHAHKVTAALHGGALKVTMASGADEVLAGALASAIAKTQADQPKRVDSQKKAILGYLNGALGLVTSIEQDWIAAEAKDPRGGNKKLTYEQFMRVRVNQITSNLKPLVKYKIEDLHDLLTAPKKRTIPSGYDIRKKLYDRTTGGAWSSLSKTWKLPRIAAISAKCFAIWTLRQDKSNPQNYKIAEARWNGLIAAGELDPKQIPTFSSYDHLKHFSKFEYETDHKVPLGTFWNGGEKNSDDSARRTSTLNQGNFQLLTRSANQKKSGVDFDRDVGPNFTSGVGNCPKDSRTLDGIAFKED